MNTTDTNEPTERDEPARQIDDSPASALAPTATRAAAQADADKDLPNADTDTKQTEKAAKGRSSS